MTDEQKGYLQALADLRSWHRWQIEQALGDVRAMRPHETAIAYLDLLIATKKQHAAEDEAERLRADAANAQIGMTNSRRGTNRSNCELVCQIVDPAVNTVSSSSIIRAFAALIACSTET